MDPLRPFLTLVRALWTDSAASVKATRRPPVDGSGSTSAAGEVAASMPIERRLQSQLAALRSWNPQRAREIFVTQVLLGELGQQLTLDPAFMDLVQKVSAQLGNELKLSARLDRVLRDLAGAQ